MAISDDLDSDVSTIIGTQWDKRRGTTVPSTDTVALAGGAVELDATFLYADLANSSKMARHFDRRIVAKILKSFLATATRLIRFRGGTVLSFDGDRVLGVFVGDSKNTSAVRCALNINYTVTQLIRKKFENQYDVVRNADFHIDHAVGVDTGTVLIVRAGARGANDLISIGRAPNLAAKFSDLREGNYSTFISADVYRMMNEEVKLNLQKTENMWEARSWNFLNESISMYRSSWWRKP